VIDFGDVALAGAFLKPEAFPSERKYPLSLEFCESCYAVQVPEIIRPVTLFSDYFYFSSAIGTMREHFKAYARSVVEEYRPESVLEIGCNDGVLLKPLADLGVKRLIGIDPAKNVVETIQDPRIEVRNAFWGKHTQCEPVDMIVANNVFAHIADINGATEAIARTLKPKGVFVFEVNRLDSLVSGLQYDWIYHEHLYYYSILSLMKHLARFGLEVFDLKWIGTHAGSVRYYVGRKGEHPVTMKVGRQVERDKWHGLDKLETFQRFADEAKAHREEMREIVQGRNVVGYGACGRTNTMLQWCGLDHRDIAYIVDDAPAKQGYYTPGTHIPITGKLNDADMVIVFAWSFLKEIEPKLRGFLGEVVIPLPTVYRKQRLAA
jgi:SAM-dependent methyltransferase